MNDATCSTWPAPPDDNWATLPFVGVMTDGDGGYLELRNAPSGTTLSRTLLCSGCGAKACWQGQDGAWRCERCDREWGMR